MVTQVYFCDHCKGKYSSYEEAVACEQQQVPLPFNGIEVGSFIIRDGFGWYDWDPACVLNPELVWARHTSCPNGNSNCFRRCCNYGLIYVVTAIELVNHEWRYHLATKAMTPKSGYQTGWTSKDHIHLTSFEPTKVLEVEDLLGKKAKGLL